MDQDGAFQDFGVRFFCVLEKIFTFAETNLKIT